MSGHNTICTATALLETGMVPMVEPVTEFVLEAPAGAIPIRAQCSGGKAVSITLRNVASFVGHLEVKVQVPEIGEVACAVVYGGMWYCIVEAAEVELELVPENGKRICRLGEMIKVACREQFGVRHHEIDYAGCDILCFRGPASPGSGATSRNAVVMSNGELDWARPETWTAMIDRSPCGTGTSAVMALLYAQGKLQLGQEFVHESIVGTIFRGRLVEEVPIEGADASWSADPKVAVVPEITGSAWITQFSRVLLQPTDPFPEGYTVGDIWC
eukprot:TRINITY_DN7419_c0_g1_i4.p1 TRINITY_DN7419_c0_g1~~TRINITY_DN7419_c0_g1_i4.p1  ORF type:complete len:272 (+),score=66.89 TRINITY_DN7419_c0_g1_i4:578-1393(+)